jgi:hypothetical protein
METPLDEVWMDSIVVPIIVFEMAAWIGNQLSQLFGKFHTLHLLL